MTDPDNHDESVRFSSPPEVLLSNCNCCPRECGADRTAGELGFCNIDDGIAISSICAHHGEEPVFSGPHGICNIFLSHCNMQCIFCQNYQISDNQSSLAFDCKDLDHIVAQVEAILSRGAIAVGFVSPSHSIPQMKQIMQAINDRGHYPVWVYNSNGYDKAEMIRSMEGIIDVYLPDMKYMDNRLASEYSSTPDYTDFACEAIKEMFRQKGADLHLDESGLVTSGLVIRHLILPGQVENSRQVLRFIARELSPDVYISLMSQYYPTPRVARHPVLGRTLRASEYQEVIGEFERLGFHRGFVQQLSSPHHYRPDFLKEHPFED
ncbi:MAG: 4Fe-4S cluster-binding domain-containing protein [Candidatus Zixiibacteriota bacterium]|nr:MAG: 4Fe-4S cluster-binding domain-containing protein [candidate division Zixibacteria bacterium]